MGLLRHEATGELWTLHARTLVGRNPVCQIRLLDRRASAEHAAICWDGEGWELRDLGSTNGSWVDGRRVSPSGLVRLGAGSRLAFGREDDPWSLVELGAPVARAEEAVSSRRRDAVQELLVLPDDEAPEVSIYLDASGGWVSERHDEIRPLRDQSLVPAGGTVWRVYLPLPVAPTLPSGATAPFAAQFRVSGDEEYVELDIVQRQRRFAIGARSFNYLLLTLARERLEDRERPETEQGWMHQEDLAKMLGISDITVYTQVHRARQRLAEAGVSQGAAIVERRHRTRQLRMGTTDIVELGI